MAGTVILKKQNTNTIDRIANLNTSSFTKTSLCSLYVQLPQFVAANNSNKCNWNYVPMKQKTTNNCLNSSCRLYNRALTNYSYSIKTTLQNRQQPARQRPITFGLAVIIMLLSILLLQKPAMVYSKSISAPAPTHADKEALAEKAIETETKLLASLLATETQPKEHMSALTDESLTNSLEMLDVLRHIQHNERQRRERRMRLRKRHTGELIITKYLHETGHNLEWNNPCNVDHVSAEIDARQQVTKQQVYQYLRKLERDVGMEYELISGIANTINIDDMADWSKHDDLYKFLPKLNVNGSIAISRWYRNMQVYVAAFGYLARSQYHFDQRKLMFVGQTSNELNKLLASARFILCELETTINGSAPNNNLKKLRTISRRAMSKRLNFVTKHQLANGAVVAANTVDLKFAKHSYYQFLTNMQKILRLKLRNKGRKYGIVEDSTEENNSQTLVVGDDNSSLDFSAIFKSDASLTVGESVEMLLKTTHKPHAHRRRQHKRKSSVSAEA